MAAAEVLIAGCGDIGGGLALSLCAAGFTVTGLRRRAHLIPEGVEPLGADLAVPDSLTILSERRFRYVVIASAAAAYDAASYRRVYVDGLRNLLRSLRGEPRLLLLSSTAVYHQHAGEWVDEDSPTAPGAFSGQLLLEAEALLREHAPGRSTVLRLGGIYGPGRERLLREVRDGVGCPREPLRYSNRIHRDDCIGILRFLIDRLECGAKLAPVYLGVDDDPAPIWEVRHWLAARLGITLDDALGGNGARMPGSKRCSNRRLHESGYQLLYPDFRAGYGALLDALRKTPPL